MAGESYLDINPRGQVPALMHPDGTVITEGSAILLHIADAFPDAALAPPPGTSQRALHDRWLLFFHANLYEGELRNYYPDRYTSDPDCAGAVQASARDYVRRHYALFNAAKPAGPWALGNDFTTVDIYLWMLIQWTERPWMAEHCPQLLEIADRTAARPRIAPVHARHFGVA